jgi:hypothetical protein
MSMFIFAGTGPALEGECSSIATFYEELIRHWPEIDTVPEDEIDNKEYCPWSCALNRSGMAVVMPCVWSMADKVVAFVEALARKHGLVLFNSQSGTVSLPEHLKNKTIPVHNRRKKVSR